VVACWLISAEGRLAGPADPAKQSMIEKRGPGRAASSSGADEFGRELLSR